MQCPKCNQDNPKEAMFCMKCGTKLGRKCPKCDAEYPEEAMFCMKCGAKLKETPKATIPKLEDMHTQLQSLIPEALAQKYLSAEQMATGENRPVTALFADISGFTPLSADKSSETIFQMVQDCFKKLVSIVAKYEGSISGFRGDGLLALFGAPILHENDAERAILSAIDMREAIGDYDLKVSIGINTAMMTVGEIQTQLHNEYTAYGNDINLAKRLQESAEAGQILVGSGTHRLTRRAFDFDVIPSLAVKGFSQPVTAYSVKQVKTHPEKLRGIEGLRARMIGREHEFTDVKESVDEWLSGHGQIVSIIGEAGIGKSRLVSELKAYLSSKNDDLQYIEGRCVSIGQPISYWPFIDILKTYFNLSEGDDTATIANKVTESITGLMPQSSDETLPLLGQLLSIKFGNELDDRLKFATPEQIRHQTLMRLRDIFTTLARQKPLLLILEDLHWSDDLSLDLISLLMDELANTPLMLLCVYRPEKEHRVWQLSDQARRKCMDRYTEITLKPLSSGESRELIESLLEIDNLPEDTKSMILNRSEGNPFFIEEVIRSLIEQGMIYQENDRWVARDEIADIDVPDTIQSVILSRVDRLQSEAKYVLQCASVIGRLFKHRLLEHLTHQEQKLNRYISEFEDRELVYQERMIPELEYAFKHALTQEATYQSILERKRREFHLHVAQGIERLYQERLEEYYEELAEHYSKSDDIEKAIEYMLKVGERAKRNYANDTAISYYQGVLDMLEKHNIENNEWKLEALKNIGDIYSYAGRITEAVQFLEEAITLAQNMNISPRQLANLYNLIGGTFWWQSEDDKMVQCGEKILAILGDDDKCLEAVLGNSWIALGSNNDRYRECIYKNIELVKNLEYSPELRAIYDHIICFYNYFIGDLETALSWCYELKKHAEIHNDLRALAGAVLESGIIMSIEGNLKGAIQLNREVIDKFSQIGDKVHTIVSRVLLDGLLWNLGELEELKTSSL
ncbi:TPA: zinc-ribbon domain-containing protein, partial [bacterium]|nr:zinc-ribbon domain-containing protein [bacterium]